MRISQNGIVLIKKFEGCVLTAYKDIAGVLTIGYGHTGHDVTQGLHISQTRANELLRQDLTNFETGVNDCVKVPLNQNQFDALVSFSFNVGMSALRKSTLLKKLNNKDYTGAANEFDRWIHAGGRVVRGLQNRRDAEQLLFLTPVKQPTPPQGIFYYTVVKGDNLTKIAKRYNTTINNIVKLNNLPNPNLIFEGQRLRIN